MLTHKKSWRLLRSRTHPSHSHRSKHDAEYRKYLQSEAGAVKEKDGLEAAAEEKPPVSIANARSIELNSLSSLIARPTSDGVKKVRFSPIIRVSLVPCRADFRDDFYMLFWDREDYLSFKEDALRELRAHWIEHKTTVKEAIFELYQPKPTPEVLPAAAVPDKLLKHVDSMGVMKNLGEQLNDMLVQCSTDSSDKSKNEKDAVTRSQSSDCVMNSHNSTNGGLSLLEHVTTNGISSITPLRKDTKEPKKIPSLTSESAPQLSGASNSIAPPVAHLVLHAVSAPALLMHSEEHTQNSTAPSALPLSLKSSGRSGSSDNALISYTGVPASALTHLPGESSSSCASSYEAPIMIC